MTSWRKKYAKEELNLWRQGKLSIIIPCITCGREFESEGITMRMCKKCRSNSAYFSGDDVAFYGSYSSLEK